MIINRETLDTLYVGYSAIFQRAMRQAPSDYMRVAMMVPSSTTSNEYGWLEQIDDLREWIGERQVTNLTTRGYTIRNKTWERTVGVPRETIEDDQIGLYGPRFEEMGDSVGRFPDRLVFGLLKDGFTTACYDNQFFFDTNHPVVDANGVTQSVSNTGGGSGAAWYLLDVSRPIKPIIYQTRRPFEMTRMDAPTDEGVFMRNEFRYGVDGRANVGYGLWQFAYGSKQTLDATNYAAARAALMGMRGHKGVNLDVRPNLLVVPPTLEAAARSLLEADRNASGATNVWRNSAQWLATSWVQ